MRERPGDFSLPLRVAGPVSFPLHIEVMGRARPRPQGRLSARPRRSASGQEFSTGGDHPLGPLMRARASTGCCFHGDALARGRRGRVPELFSSISTTMCSIRSKPLLPASATERLAASKP
jgi:hypothetical protein